MNRVTQRLLSAVLLLSFPALEAAKRKLPTDLESPEGVLLKAAMDEADAGKKVGLLEDFAAKHPAHESATWVWGEVQTAYLAANEFDKAIAAGETDGFVKTVFDGATGALIGAHLIGHEVTEMIQGYTVARTLETTEAELMHTIFPHPTISEAMHEAVLAAYGRAIHF